MNRLLLHLLVAAVSLSAVLAQEKGWARLTGCRLMENNANDGDSFHVQYQGKEFIFRLYFVDACETSEQIPTRVQEQAKFLNIPVSRVIPAGLAAEKMTKKYLSGTTFTVVTRWEDAKGASRLPRNYAFVLFGDNDEHDLASTLIQNGLARIYGMPTDPPGSVTAAQFQGELRKREASAKQRAVGIWGDLAANSSAAGSGVTGGAATGASSRRNYSSAMIVLPANSHPPDVVDNPADDTIADFAVEAAEAPMPVQTVVPEGNFSEIPGWKPKAKSTPAPDSSPAL